MYLTVRFFAAVRAQGDLYLRKDNGNRGEPLAKPLFPVLQSHLPRW